MSKNDKKSALIRQWEMRRRMVHPYAIGQGHGKFRDAMKPLER